MQADFRADIQGLRAVAVGLVALDHAAVGPLDGGFVGVDVFFVISGFLITSLLLRELTRTGRISLRDFYARRARRILPAALVVILATLVLGVLFLDGAAALLVGEQAVWATFFAANIKLAADSTDYFAADQPASPLQHFWSLAVEEQFYLFWPLILLLALLLLRRRLGAHRTAYAVLAVAISVSFVWSLSATETSPLSAYFSTLGRAWELAIGGLVAAALPALSRLGPSVRSVASWMGLVLIGSAALLYSAATPFPGYAAAVPVVGAALLLLGGHGAVLRWAPQGVLSTGPMRAVGDWSYSLYLWHWPLIVVAGYVWQPVAGWTGVAVLAVAVAVSAASYRWVETPFRVSRALTRKEWGRTRSLLLYPAMVIVVLPTVAAAHHAVRATVGGGGPAISATEFGQEPGAATVDLGRDPYLALVEASVRAADNAVDIPAGLMPDPLELTGSIPDLGDCEYFGMPADQLSLCPRGDLDADRTMVLIGDSHARQWIPALDEIAEEEGLVAYYLVRQGCPAVDQTPWRINGDGPNYECEEFQDWAAETVRELRPEVTLLATHVDPVGYAGPDGHVEDDATIEQMAESGLVAQIERVKPYSDRTLVIGDPPTRTIRPQECLTVRDPTLGGCLSAPEPRSEVMVAATRRGAATGGAEFVATEQWFCWDGRCPAVVGRYVTHRDVEHVTIPYAEFLAPALSRALDLGAG